MTDGTRMRCVLSFALCACLLTACGKQQQNAGNHPQAADASSTANDGTAPTALLQRWCSECHLPPPATAHKAREWRYIVLRMQSHRIAGGLPEIDRQELETLVSYFEAHAQP